MYIKNFNFNQPNITSTNLTPELVELYSMSSCLNSSANPTKDPTTGKFE